MGASWSIVPKLSRIPASNTHSLPWFAATRPASHAPIADRLGRKPWLASVNCASKTGSRTSFAAVITTRSATVGIDSGLPAAPIWESPLAAALAGHGIDAPRL